ncbi:MAG: sigma-70 family RNA polymerase sigma factor [Candidatus Brocadiae bacterium]|nr:sigma-70 family RNA polymerase sigma factor [Candidatus Brocadiia bacterium]
MDPTAPRPFPATLWTAVLAARDRDGADWRRAMDRLITAYWKPVYWVVRSRWSRPHDEAADLTQGFFLHLLEKKDALAAVAPGRGNFRTWLRTVLDNFMRNEHEAARAQKRGGGRTHVPIDAAEDAPPLPAAGLTPEQAFDRAWALHVFHAAVADLRARYRADGRDAAFRWFERHELDPDAPSCARIAEEAGVKPHEVENALKGARAAFASVLRERVRETVGEDGSVEEELRALRASLG